MNISKIVIYKNRNMFSFSEEDVDLIRWIDEYALYPSLLICM